MDGCAELPENLSNFHIHVTGVKGTGCAALTEILCARGAAITGSDVDDVFYTDAILEKLGIRAKPFDEKNVAGASLVIYSSAYNPDTHPELIEAKKQNIPLITYPQALGLISKQSFSAGIAGVHGKTSAAGLTGTLIKALGLPASALAGSVITSFNESCVMTNGSTYFAAETCEYKRNFLAFHPSAVALTSVESDHQDCFPAYEDIQNAFLDFINLLPKGGTLVYCADDKGAAETARLASRKRDDIGLIPYGETAAEIAGNARKTHGGLNAACPQENAPDNNFAITFCGIKDNRQYFRLGGFDVDFFLNAPGRHLVLNAVCALALCYVFARHSGASQKDFFSAKTARKIQEGFSRWAGAKRRSEVIGVVETKNARTVFIDDYAHHPTAIAKTLAGYREFYPDCRIIVDFMPHTFSRTSALFGEFTRAFDSADVIILHKIYASAREKAGETTVTGTMLFTEIKNTYKNKQARYFEEPLDALDFSKELLFRADTNEKAKNLFVTMGAGDNWKLGRALFESTGAQGINKCKA